MAKIEWLLFDLGGVLVDVNQDRIFEGLARYLPDSPSDLKRRLLSVSELWEPFIVQEFSPRQLTQEVNQILKTELTEDQVTAAFNAELGATIETTAATLPDLKCRTQVGCLSNTNSIHWDHLLKAYDFMGNFDRRFASQLLGSAKPGREIYEKVIELLGTRPNQVLFFDDKAENVATAQKLGWHARLYRNHEIFQSDLAAFGLE
jgi:HAD superfamily hydrolase (TIGR01509 family)